MSPHLYLLIKRAFFVRLDTDPNNPNKKRMGVKFVNYSLRNFWVPFKKISIDDDLWRWFGRARKYIARKSDLFGIIGWWTNDETTYPYHVTWESDVVRSEYEQFGHRILKESVDNLPAVAHEIFIDSGYLCGLENASYVVNAGKKLCMCCAFNRPKALWGSLTKDVGDTQCNSASIRGDTSTHFPAMQAVTYNAKKVKLSLSTSSPTSQVPLNKRLKKDGGPVQTAKKVEEKLSLALPLLRNIL